MSVTTYKTGNVHMFSLLHRSRPIHPVQSEQASGWWCRVGDNLYLCKGIWIYAQIEEGANLWHVILGCWGSKYYQGDGWLGMFLLFHTLIMWLTDNWYRVSSSTGIHKAEWNWHRTSYNCALQIQDNRVPPMDVPVQLWGGEPEAFPHCHVWHPDLPFW